MGLVVTKCFIWKHVWRLEEVSSSWHVFEGRDVSLQKLCGKEDCISHFTFHGEDIAMPLPFVLFASIFLIVVILRMLASLLRCRIIRCWSRGVCGVLSGFVAPIA